MPPITPGAIDLLAKFASGEGGLRSGELMRRRLIDITVTEGGYAVLGLTPPPLGDLATLRLAWVTKERYKARVNAWMETEGKKGNLQRNSNAPAWHDYMLAEERLGELLITILGAKETP